ncbi:uncharacterized mitochondrial protein AtMg00810-like [Rutidosis leptorrhynchoides]|uniref:uncharacterized mitochondrial protein AtMg00810-like n=1 Tax=Rutidosis leptorrhynchoides TaxID=125765 RepID=UPI003A99B096
MWILHHKIRSDGTFERYKARLVGDGRSQQVGIDCYETFSPVVKPATIRTVLSIAISKEWPIYQLDVKNAFLHGNLNETVYILKQAPRAWYQRFADFASKVGFQHSQCDHSLFIYHRGRDIAYLLLYVDDIVLTTSSDELRSKLMVLFSHEFAMKDLGPLSSFLGISVTRHATGLFLTQHAYATDIINRVGMKTCNAVTTPVDTLGKMSTSDSPLISNPTEYRSLAGGLQYLTFTRPDISYAVQQICLHMHDPHENHLLALKRIIRYLQGTSALGLHISKSTSHNLVGFTDADWAGCPDTRRSTSGYCVYLGEIYCPGHQNDKLLCLVLVPKPNIGVFLTW